MKIKIGREILPVGFMYRNPSPKVGASPFYAAVDYAINEKHVAIYCDDIFTFEKNEELYKKISKTSEAISRILYSNKDAYATYTEEVAKVNLPSVPHEEPDDFLIDEANTISYYVDDVEYEATRPTQGIDWDKNNAFIGKTLYLKEYVLEEYLEKLESVKNILTKKYA